jgi:putative membrane protein insertion efficiency factor
MKHALIGLLKAYRAVISPLYGNVCKYYPSCSAYALEAVTLHGAAKGSWLAARRLASCHPWSLGGYDPVPGTPAADEWAREQAEKTKCCGDEAAVVKTAEGQALRWT